MATQFVRQTAVPITLGELGAGTWVQAGGVEPSGVRTARGFLSRASVIGVVVDKDDAGFLLDDGTTTMSVRAFDAPPVMLRAGVGQVVLVIGRPRDYNGERYLVLEICKSIRENGWVEYRRKELALFAGLTPKEAPAHITINEESPVVVEVPATSGKSPYEVILDAIRELDSGQGADADEVLSKYNGADGESVLRQMLEEGELFEIRPGRVKVLE